MRCSLHQCSAALLAASLFIATEVAMAADTLFAAPAASPATHSSGVGSTGHVTLALAAVLVCVFAAAWVLKQMRKLQAGPHAVDIKVIAQVALGSKERAVLLQVKNVQLLVGVSAGQVSTLHTFSSESVLQPESVPTELSSTSLDGSSSASQPEKPSFQAILKRSLGL
jgi:flagellar protein FliO/FliZ